MLGLSTCARLSELYRSCAGRAFAWLGFRCCRRSGERVPPRLPHRYQLPSDACLPKFNLDGTGENRWNLIAPATARSHIVTQKPPFRVIVRSHAHDYFRTNFAPPGTACAQTAQLGPSKAQPNVPWSLASADAQKLHTRVDRCFIPWNFGTCFDCGSQILVSNRGARVSMGGLYRAAAIAYSTARRKPERLRTTL